MKDYIKKIVKLVGSILAVISIIFVVKRVLELKIDIYNWINIKIILLIVFLSIVQAVYVLISGYPWKIVISSISGEKIDFKDVMVVYAKSNLYKYIPGNIFQYIGRNEIATKKNISHKKVALATIIDVASMLIVSLTISAIMSYSSWKEFFDPLMAIGLGFLVYGIIVVAVYIVIKKTTITLKNILAIIAFLGIANLYTVVSFVVVGVFLLDSYNITFELIKDSAIYILAFDIGFVMPGASGGIGVREMIVTILTENSVIYECIPIIALILRLVGIVGDIIAFLFAIIFEKLKR